MILGGDLGGTKTLLALAERVDGVPRVVREERFDSGAYTRFDDLLADFLRGAGDIESACFGVAGPTDGRSAQFTNLSWFVDGDALQAAFGIARVQLANDFACAAQGLDLLPAGRLTTLQAGQPLALAPRIVVGAGTGLGVAGLVWHSGRYEVIAGEGGHMGFSPQTPQQAELWQWLHQQSGRVTVEDIIAGPGLPRIYAFLGGAAKTPAEIGNAALAGGDRLAATTIDLWLAMYGAFAGDLALQWLARGGVFIAGGIGAKILPAVSPQPFLAAFNAKRQHSRLAAAMPVHLVTEERLGLLGALALAALQAG